MSSVLGLFMKVFPKQNCVSPLKIILESSLPEIITLYKNNVLTSQVKGNKKYSTYYTVDTFKYFTIRT